MAVLGINELTTDDEKLQVFFLMQMTQPKGSKHSITLAESAVLTGSSRHLRPMSTSERIQGSATPASVQTATFLLLY